MTEHLRETTVESVQVYEGVFLRVRKDVARLPDGSDHPREWVMHPGAAAMAALGDDGRVLMVRQWRYPMRQAYLEIPAGKIDPGETSLQTARRELLEETGHAASEWALLTQIHPAIGFSNERIDIYLARGLTAQPRHSGRLAARQNPILASPSIVPRCRRQSKAWCGCPTQSAAE